MEEEAIIAKAADVLGGRDAALQWLDTPAFGLEWRRPFELFGTPEGRQTVMELLIRMEYCVCS